MRPYGELMQLATDYKNRGNEFFKAGNNEEAIEEYKEGIENIVNITKPTEDSNKLATILCQNFSLACVKLGQFQ